MRAKVKQQYAAYSPQLSKTLEGMQKWALYKRHDFGLGSAIGDEIIKVVNRECEVVESQFGLRRVYPGQLVWERDIDVALRGYWADGTRCRRLKKKLIVTRYNHSLLRRIVYDGVSVGDASVAQLGEIVTEFLSQGYEPDVNDLVCIGGVSKTVAEELLEDSGWLTPQLPRKLRKDGYDPDKLRSTIIAKVSGISSRKFREIELMVDDLLLVREQVAPRVENLSHGDIVGISLSKHQKKLYRNSMAELKKTVDIVKLVTVEEEASLNNGSQPYDIRESQIVRIAKDNYKQCDGVYSLPDFALKLGISSSRIGSIISAYERRSGDVVPRSGVIFDSGRTLTHKVQIINLLEDGFSLKEVKARTYHSEDAILRYGKRYEIIKELAQRCDALGITQRTGISLSEVKAYLEILKKREPHIRIKEYEKDGLYDKDDHRRIEMLLSVAEKKVALSPEVVEEVTGIPKEKAIQILEEVNAKMEREEKE